MGYPRRSSLALTVSPVIVRTRAYRVLFHPGSRSRKVLLDNFVLLGS